MARRFVIVGNGPAGASAAEAIRRRDPSAEILIVGEEKDAFYSRPGLAYLLNGSVPESHLFSRPETEYRRLGLRRAIDRADRVDRRRHRLASQGGSAVSYDRLLLAPGARAPGRAGDGPGGCSDPRQSGRRAAHRQVARRVKTAVVVGGGITALELAEGLAAQRVRVHYLLREDRHWGTSWIQASRLWSNLDSKRRAFDSTGNRTWRPYAAGAERWRGWSWRTGADRHAKWWRSPWGFNRAANREGRTGLRGVGGKTHCSTRRRLCERA